MIIRIIREVSRKGLRPVPFGIMYIQVKQTKADFTDLLLLLLLLLLLSLAPMRNSRRTCVNERVKE